MRFKITINPKTRFGNEPYEMENENALQVCIVTVTSSAYYP